jgi:hypothetical protein
MGSLVDRFSRPEHHQHRQEWVFHIDPAVLVWHATWLPIDLQALPAAPVWHRHSCLCFGKMQCLILSIRRLALSYQPIESP